jgi:hypothetical protein
MITAKILHRLVSRSAVKTAATAVGVACLAATALSAQAAYVVEPKDALHIAAATLRDRLATTGDADSFVAAGGALAAPDAEAVIPTIAAPAPEPETYALMLAGLGLVGWAARRRRR